MCRRGGLAGDGKGRIHAGLVSHHPWRSTPPPTHPAPPLTAPWWPWTCGSGGADPCSADSWGNGVQWSPPTMGRRYRLFSFHARVAATGTCQGVGRGGWAGALSAMDGAKRGPQERLLPSPDQPHRPAQTKAAAFKPPARGSHPFDPLPTRPPRRHQRKRIHRQLLGMVQPRPDLQVIHLMVQAEAQIDASTGIGLHPLLGQHHLPLR